MRPTLLKMKAFGSYAQPTTVEFENLTGGLYLIVGKTGAGKTTIFDAISFALFGRPSGSERTADMLHSDFVPLSEDTEVALDFIHQGKKYHVERSIHFPKARGGGGYGDGKISATMKGENQAAIEVASQVTARCEELLGLNAEQFRRIVMLAQGEFREFLRSDSNKKNDILGRLFDNTEYVRFQNLLASARDTLQKQRKTREEEIESVMLTLFQMPEDADEEETEGYQHWHPHLVENLQALVQKDEEKLNLLDDVKKKLDGEVERLARKEGAATADNANLLELEAKRAHLDELIRQSAIFSERKGNYAAAEKAIHKVIPREIDYNRASKRLTDTNSEIEEKETQEQQQVKTLTEAQAAVEADKPSQEAADNLYAAAERLKELLPIYQKVKEKEKEREATQQLLDKTKKSIQEQIEKKTQLSEKQSAIQAELTELADCKAEEVRLPAEKNLANEQWETLAKPKAGLADQVKEVLSSEQELFKQNSIIETLIKEASKAQNDYNELYQAFLAGQAGLIAVDMEKELAESGKTVCPVCNTPFCRDQAHQFALPAERVPGQKEVDAANRNAKAADDKWKNARADYQNKQSLIEQQKKNLLEKMQKLVPDCSNWETIIAAGWLENLCGQFKANLQKKENAYDIAQKKCARQNDLQREEKDNNSKLEEINNKLEADKTESGAQEVKLQSIVTALAELMNQLPYPEETEARNQLKILNDKRNVLLEEIKEHSTALSNAQNALGQTMALLKSLRDSIPELNSAVEDAESLLTKALQESGFVDLESAKTALIPLGDMDGESWLLSEKEALDQYANDLEITRSRIGELEAQTKDKVMVDIDALKEALAEAKDRQAEANGESSNQKALLNGHKAVLEKIRTAKKELAETSNAWKRINRLAELGVGVNSEGGKLSFDRYVMGAIFREVLEMANRRLNIMTGGRFELVHSVEAGRKNAAAGLEIEVLDVTLGKQRASGSISGGEGFMVSLALALGLSDVVQNHAGGQKLDTLFIDEGFGTLDDGKLDNVIDVLKQLTEGNRLVGIISHVDKLEESIPQKLRVESGEKGSTLKLELS